MASFVDSVVGGGGLISLPSLLFLGLPPQLALGTNKLAGVISSFTSSVAFFRSGHVETEIIRWFFPLSLGGSVLGVLAVRRLPSDFLRPLVVVMLVLVALYTVFRKEWGQHATYGGPTPRVWTLGGAAALGLGFYDGFFGPGAGSFLLFVFLMLGFDFVRGAGNARVLNFASNIAAIVTFALLGSVQYTAGLVMGIGMVGVGCNRASSSASPIPGRSSAWMGVCKCWTRPSFRMSGPEALPTAWLTTAPSPSTSSISVLVPPPSMPR